MTERLPEGFRLKVLFTDPSLPDLAMVGLMKKRRWLPGYRVVCKSAFSTDATNDKIIRELRQQANRGPHNDDGVWIS